MPQRLNQKQKDQRFPKYSIVTIVKNGGTFLTQACQSVDEQTLTDYEHLIFVVPCPENPYDDTLAIAEMTIRQNPRRKVEMLREGHTRGSATKYALTKCTGQYIGFLDHADMLKPSSLQRVSEIMDRNPDIGMSYTKRLEVDENLEVIGVSAVTEKPYSRFNLLSSVMCSQLRTFRTEVLRPLIHRWEPVNWAVDYDLMVLMSENTNVLFIPEILYHNRRWSGSFKTRYFFEYYSDYKQIVDASLIRSGMAECGYTIQYRCPEIDVILHKDLVKPPSMFNSEWTPERWKESYQDKQAEAGAFDRQLTEWINQILMRTPDRGKDVDILDIGCGNGSLLSRVSPCKKHGLDFHVEYRDYDNEAGITPEGEDSEPYDRLRKLPAQSYDIIVMQDVLQFTSRPHLLMFEAYRVARHNGKVYIAVQDFKQQGNDVRFWRSQNEFEEWVQTFFTIQGTKRVGNGLILECSKLPEPEYLANIPVTILIPSENRGELLRQCLYLTALQSHRNLHWHIFDDGSTDETDQIIETAREKFEPDRFQYTKLPHIGIAAVYPYSYGSVETPYLCQVDSDDYIAPRTIELCLNAFLKSKDPKLGVIFTDYTIMNVNHQIEYIGDRSRIPWTRDNILDFFMSFQFRLIKTEFFKQMPKADFPMPGAGCGPDYDLCIRLSDVCNMEHRRFPFYYYRQHGQTINSNRQMEQRESSAIFLTAARERRAAQDAERINGKSTKA